MTDKNSKSPNIYIPGLPSLGSKDIALYSAIHNARLDLVTQLSAKGCEVDDIDGQRPWLKTMLQHAEKSDAFVFPPMTSLPEHHKSFKSEAAQRWFEFFSLITGVHVGSREKYGSSGVSKPCIVMDPDGQWASAIDLLKDLHEKGMFSSEVSDIVQVVGAPAGNTHDYHALNKDAVAALSHALENNKGKPHKQVHSEYPETHIFPAFRKDMARHPFGLAFFGSATTGEPAYKKLAFDLAKLAGERGWRMITGAGAFGCMGAADQGFAAGKKEFNLKYKNAPFKPAHVGVSTQAILRLEGPPPDLDQLIITDNIYDRMEVMIRGQKSGDPLQRARDAVKVLFVGPGGTGTLHEFATLLQLATNGTMMKDRKIVLLNPPSHLNAEEGFWDPLLKTAKKLGFDNMFEVAKTPEEAIAIADKAYLEWLDRHQEHRNLPHPEINPRGVGPTQVV